MTNYKNKEWLYREYVTNDKSSNEIAEECGVNGQTILTWLAKFDISRRQNGQRSARTAKKEYPTECRNCGKTFFVDMPCKADPNNKHKFVRACSPECTSALKSKNIRTSHAKGKIPYTSGPQRFLNRDELMQLICYEHLYYADVAKRLKVKYTILQREIERLNIPREFYRTCPQCGEEYACKMRCQVDESSNKFKKFCSHKCFLSSRKNTDTWIERVTAEFLDHQGVEYVPQYSIGRMTADFYIPSKNLIVETNGDFWHANPRVYTDPDSLHPIQRRAIEKDERKLRQLSEKGYDVFILWENDLQNQKDAVLSELLEHIREAS